MDISKILDNIYDRSIAIILEIAGTYFFWKKKKNQNVIFMFSFYLKSCRTGSRKTSITQELLFIESCLTSLWVTFLIFCRLVYDIFSHSNDLILAWSTLLQVSHPNSKVSHQNSRLVYEIFQFLKQAVSATWHANSNLVIIMELKRKIEYRCGCTFWTS